MRDSKSDTPDQGSLDRCNATLLIQKHLFLGRRGLASTTEEIQALPSPSAMGFVGKVEWSPEAREFNGDYANCRMMLLRVLTWPGEEAIDRQDTTPVLSQERDLCALFSPVGNARSTLRELLRKRSGVPAPALQAAQKGRPVREMR
jgi:hypothetical protein